MDNEPVQSTCDYANECKRSAVELGYWKDGYISHFHARNNRKPPAVNLFFAVRVQAMEALINKFLEKVGNSDVQIINLGAGYETLFWRLKDRKVPLAKFVEVDLPPVTAKKCYLIEKNERLLETVRDEGEVKIGATDLHSKVYHLVAADLRNLSELQDKLSGVGIDFTVPTLFLAEYVLVYIRKDNLDRMLTWIASQFKSSVFLNHEMCNISDEQGLTMVNNLHSVGCHFTGVEYCSNLEMSKMKFLNNNWDGCKAWELIDLYNILPESEKKRFESLECLDTPFNLPLLRYFCNCVAWMGKEYEGIGFHFS